MINNYYIMDNGQQLGPYSHQELTEMGLAGSTLILSPLAVDWQNAYDLPEFTAYFEDIGIYHPTASNLANFWWRLLAYIIDYVVLIIFLLVFAIGFQLFMQIFHINFDLFSKENDNLFKLIAVLIFITYNSIFEATEIQGSIGKKICRMAVVDIDGNRIRFSKSLSRNAGKILSSLLCCIGFLSVLWDDHKQAWHDHLAKTYIVRKPK